MKTSNREDDAVNSTDKPNLRQILENNGYIKVLRGMGFGKFDEENDRTITVFDKLERFGLSIQLFGGDYVMVRMYTYSYIDAMLEPEFDGDSDENWHYFGPFRVIKQAARRVLWVWKETWLTDSKIILKYFSKDARLLWELQEIYPNIAPSVDHDALAVPVRRGKSIYEVKNLL